MSILQVVIRLVQSGESATRTPISWCVTILLASQAVSALKTNVQAAPLFVHLRADAGVTSGGVGSTVTAWKDQSANGFDFRNDHPLAGMNDPTLVNGPNGNPAISFDANDLMDSDQSMSLFTSPNSGLTIFTVIKPNTIDGGQHFLVNHASTIGGGDSLELGVNAGLLNTPGSWGIHRGSANATGTGSNELIAGQFVIMASQILTSGIAPSNIEYYRNGDLLANASSGWFSAGSYPISPAVQLTIGSRVDNKNGAANHDNVFPDSFFNGDVAEIMIFREQLSDADRDLITFELGQKYGIAVSVQPAQAVPEPSNIAIWLVALSVCCFWACRRRGSKPIAVPVR